MACATILKSEISSKYILQLENKIQKEICKHISEYKYDYSSIISIKDLHIEGEILNSCF